jgi:hypothetical protein
MSVPSIRISPVDGWSRPAMRPISVDLPLPDGPTMASRSPALTCRSSGCRMVSGWPPLDTVFETPRRSIMNGRS